MREIQPEDIQHIADYWLTASPDFLTGMGVDLKQLPTRLALTEMLEQQIKTDYRHKTSYALIWELNGIAVGHSNVNRICFGKSAYMHLHLWPSNKRKKGMGLKFVLQSIPFFFQHLQLQQLFCEPYALNPAPNKTLKKAGFQWIKSHVTIPGTLNFKQEVNTWLLTHEQYQQF